MSLWGRILLSLSGFSLILIVLARWILGGWYNFLYIFLFLLFGALLGAVIADRKIYWNFLSLKTTKNGMSMGMSILISLVFCFSLGYLGAQFNKSFDITQEKINSLAPQTASILDSMEEDIYFKVFYKGRQGLSQKERIKESLRLFKQNRSHVKDRYYDAYLKNKLAQEYLNEQSKGTGPAVFVFVEYKNNKVMVEEPFDEEKITTALIKASRRDKKTIYFISGHAEKDTEDEGPEGLSALKDALLKSAFKMTHWNFIQNGALPKTADLVIIAGPAKKYFEKEQEFLKNYLDQGGKLFIALDPDKQHGLAGFLKSYGVVYENTYIMDRISAVVSMGPFSPLGLHFAKDHPITKSFPRGSIALFHIASALNVQGVEDSTELVKTNVNSVSTVSRDKKDIAQGKRAAHVLGLFVKLKKSPADDSKESDTTNQALVVFGDSDFLSNQFFNSSGMNRDLIMNAVSYLVDESDLVSIRPKRLKSTVVALKTFDQIGVVLFSIVLPLVCFVMSFIIWFRRRGA